MIVAALKLMRPGQWVKNGFVFFGLLFGHAWHATAAVQGALFAFVAFCLMSSAVYALNDLRDIEQDRLHPVKRLRPLAAGTLSPSVAIMLMAACSVLSLWLAGQVGDTLVYLLCAYGLMNFGYSYGLKRVVVLDVFIISAGFMLRLLAGTTGLGIPPSNWLLMCGLLLTLFLGFAKRRAELMLMEDGSGAHRRVLDLYSATLLDQFITITGACSVVAYALYTVDEDTVRTHGTTHLIYTLPFVLYGLFRYLYLLHRRGGGGDPSHDVFRDRHLLVAMAGWLAVTLYLLG
ncbi:MAG: decaprenyl-phosphate phosphoribosyltransferase [Gammaproteobacteria bacterium]|jgi:4-hydroxybenzoate polyprenyltransferase|nr:decaprenyl-phosphate phosphoribosyltransferase [Gammaproteobacteria bacterium]MBU0772875.1 decaprenyl-phosphate phosphoribosyltransferase [Gammaproteobacteria bacterium]MBU0854839.1 decaprenyl-phosphate phosphoribosyltransferase [Gammaproteobacteria bacterium]MBU1847617.1 decaprenyl-phosphate phosphoribosyltransferase [Gammaproteobacteria bacterium]